MITLDDLIPADSFVGVSLILPRGGRFLYGIRPPRPDRSGQAARSKASQMPVLEITGIGGGLEPQDADYVAGARREAQEEVGCDVQIVDCAQTLHIQGPDAVTCGPLEGENRPVAVVFRHHRAPPHQPWHPHRAGDGYLIVCLAVMACAPTPTHELPWLLWLDADQVLATARADVFLEDLLRDGAELVTGDAGPPPPGSLARLTDSQEALGLALGDTLPALYRSLAALAGD
jgi:8-oxo-dGTP pyrophosphatase MutT (NUDIX family)